MKLIFYSGGQTSKNHVLHQAFARLAGNGRAKSLTYIPFCGEESRHYFRRAIRRYEPFGFRKFRCLPVDEPFTDSQLREALASDAIYLAGGNTFYFLHHLRKSGLLPRLQEFARRGGVLAGLSAGGLILSPTIALAGYPPSDADENTVGLKNLRGLGLVSFEFFPHFESRPGLSRALKRYSSISKNPILAVRDGGGIVVDGATMHLHGKVIMWRKGEAFDLAAHFGPKARSTK